jgi:hypothetical protein
VNYWLMNVRDAAHVADVPLRTVQRWVLLGWLADHGDGMTYLVDIRELTALDEQRPAAPGKRPRLRNPNVMA